MIVSFYRAASEDVASYIEYLLDEFAYNAAERFPVALEEAVAFVVSQPDAGPLVLPSALRSWPLPGFPNVQLY